MKVTAVSLRSTEAADKAGHPALTPELLAATGARYSRSNEGLDTILSRIDPTQMDRSVDSIFRMIDYGHQSIADMAPVAMFIDNISIWLAYFVWTLCPTAGGQESSTRYIRLSSENVVSPLSIGLPSTHVCTWQAFINDSFSAYEESLRLWERLVTHRPELARIPEHVLSDTSDKGLRTVARLRRNFGFDRARVFIPAATSTNMMLLMSARGWVHLCQVLLSHSLPEALVLGTQIRNQLELVTPRLIKHAVSKNSIRDGLQATFETLSSTVSSEDFTYLNQSSPDTVHPSEAFLDVSLPHGVDDNAIASALKYRENRYDWVGDPLKRTAVRFGWTAVSFGELRDLNRHRTGNKYCPLRPLGFYYSFDQFPTDDKSEAEAATLRSLARFGQASARHASQMLSAGDPSYVYWLNMGTQFAFEHVTTADKFIYEAELRTGTGAHFRYAQHFRDLLKKWFMRFPSTQNLVLQGSAEPE